MDAKEHSAVRRRSSPRDNLGGKRWVSNIFPNLCKANLTLTCSGAAVTYQLIAGGGYDEPPFSGAIAEYPW
jgi:hypothetical protein